MPTIVISNDPDPDLSWLDQACYDPRSPEYAPTFDANGVELDPDWYRDHANHITLQMVVYNDEGAVIDSLVGIDFLEPSNEWTTGSFDSIEAIPSRCPYLRELAEEMI